MTPGGVPGTLSCEAALPGRNSAANLSGLAARRSRHATNGVLLRSHKHVGRRMAQQREAGRVVAMDVPLDSARPTAASSSSSIAKVVSDTTTATPADSGGSDLLPAEGCHEDSG